MITIESQPISAGGNNAWTRQGNLNISTVGTGIRATLIELLRPVCLLIAAEQRPLIGEGLIVRARWDLLSIEDRGRLPNDLPRESILLEVEYA